MKGLFKFNPFEPIFNGTDSFPTAPSIEEVSKRIHEKIVWIKEWGTLMNIMEMKSWIDPITQDVHIVLRHGKMLSAEHLADTAEMLPPTGADE